MKKLLKSELSCGFHGPSWPDEDWISCLCHAFPLRVCHSLKHLNSAPLLVFSCLILCVSSSVLISLSLGVDDVIVQTNFRVTGRWCDHAIWWVTCVASVFSLWCCRSIVFDRPVTVIVLLVASLWSCGTLYHHSSSKVIFNAGIPLHVFW